MADQRIINTEEMVGADHATKSDTLNRLAVIDHENDGQHKLAGFQGSQYAADAQANDTYVITLDPVPSAYFTGMEINFKANTINTGAATLNVNSLGAKTIKKNHDQDLDDGDIEANQIVKVIYDGTDFQMQSHASSGPVCFQVHPAAPQNNIAVGSDVTVAFGTERFDIGNNFASNIFTAPITGKYLLSFALLLEEIDTAADYYLCSIKTSNKTYSPFKMDPRQFNADINFWYLGGSIVVDMDINDTAYIIIKTETGVAQTNITVQSIFSGVKL